jgi:hypothetical protein
VIPDRYTAAIGRLQTAAANCGGIEILARSASEGFSFEQFARFTLRVGVSLSDANCVGRE